MNSLIVLLELIVLHVISTNLEKSLFRLFMLLTGSRTVAISIVTIIVFPGTVIHELSHLFIAEILGVKTGKLTLVPEALEGEVIQAGSVTMVKTDPFRKAIIGTSPLFVSLILVTIISYWIPIYIETIMQTIPYQNIVTSISFYIVVFLLYLLFCITNSMFPSRVDLKGFPAVAIVLVLIFAAIYFVGFRFSLTGESLRIVTSTISAIMQSLGLVLAINVALLLMTHLLIALSGKMLKRKLIR